MNVQVHKQTKLLAQKRMQAIKEEKPKGFFYDDEYSRLQDTIRVADYHIRQDKRYNQLKKK